VMDFVLVGGGDDDDGCRGVIICARLFKLCNATAVHIHRFCWFSSSKESLSKTTKEPREYNESILNLTQKIQKIQKW